MHVCRVWSVHCYSCLGCLLSNRAVFSRRVFDFISAMVYTGNICTVCFGVQNDLQRRRSEMAAVRGKLRDVKHTQVRARRYFQEYEQGLKRKMQHLDTAEEQVCIHWMGCGGGAVWSGCVPGEMCGVGVYQEGLQRGTVSALRGEPVIDGPEPTV